MGADVDGAVQTPTTAVRGDWRSNDRRSPTVSRKTAAGNRTMHIDGVRLHCLSSHRLSFPLLLLRLLQCCGSAVRAEPLRATATAAANATHTHRQQQE